MTLVIKTAQFVYDFSLEQKLKPTNFFAVPEGPREFASEANKLLLKNSAGYKDSSGRLIVPATGLRAGYKTHGSVLDRYSVGPIFPWMRPDIIEDVNTTGNSSSEFVMLLQELGINPEALISMLSRLQRRSDGKSVQDFFEKDYNIKLLVMTTADRVLPKAVEILKPNERVLRGLREELNNLQEYLVPIKV